MSSSIAYTPAPDDSYKPARPLPQSHQYPNRAPNNPSIPFQTQSTQLHMQDQKHLRQTNEHWDPLSTEKLDKAHVVHFDRRKDQERLSKLNVGTWYYRGENLHGVGDSDPNASATPNSKTADNLKYTIDPNYPADLDWRKTHFHAHSDENCPLCREMLAKSKLTSQACPNQGYGNRDGQNQGRTNGQADGQGALRAAGQNVIDCPHRHQHKQGDGCWLHDEQQYCDIHCGHSRNTKCQYSLPVNQQPKAVVPNLEPKVIPNRGLAVSQTVPAQNQRAAAQGNQGAAPARPANQPQNSQPQGRSNGTVPQQRQDQVPSRPTQPQITKPAPQPVPFHYEHPQGTQSVPQPENNQTGNDGRALYGRIADQDELARTSNETNIYNPLFPTDKVDMYDKYKNINAELAKKEHLGTPEK